MVKPAKRGSAVKGTRGPPKTPTAQLKKSGAGNDKRRDKQMLEPIPIMGVPEIPFHVLPLLDDKAREHWGATTIVLDRMGVLGDIDAHVMARYCILFSNWYKCQEHSLTEGLTYVHYTAELEGSRKPTPEAAMAVKYGEQMLKIEREFGMTASARASIDLNKAKDPSKSPAGEYLANNA